MRGSPLNRAKAGEYEVLAEHTEGDLVYLLMRRPTDPGNSIYYYALPRQQVSFQSDSGMGDRSVLKAEEGEDGKIVCIIYHRPF